MNLEPLATYETNKKEKHMYYLLWSIVDDEWWSYYDEN